MTNIIKRIFKFKILLIVLFFTYSFSQEKVTLQLKWFHQFQFAGYYAAKEKGFYDEVGLDVEIKERTIELNNIEQVINGSAQYGIADSILLLYKAKDKPIVIVSPIFQHSPSVLISLKSSKINSPYELNDKDIIFYEKDIDGFTILAMFKKLGIKPNFTRKREADDYLKLINNQASTMPAYLSNEPFYFKEKGIDINIINPMHYGFDLYGDILFTNKDEAINHPERVEKFKKATLKGWEYALNNKEEIIQLIHEKYNTKKSLEHLRYEADIIEEMIDRKKVSLGSVDKGRIQYISQLYKDYGLSKNDLDVKDFIFEEYKNNLDLTQEELSYLKNKKELSYCIDPNWMPYEKNIDSKHMGISGDFFNLFKQKIGIPINFIPTKTWLESYSLAVEKKCDILSLVMQNKERVKYFNFTKPYIETPLVIITKNEEFYISNILDVLEKKLGIVKGYAYIDILKEKYPNINLIEVDNIEIGLEKVKNGELYGFIDTLTTTAYEIQNKYMGQLIVSSKFEEIWKLGIGSRNDEPLLNDILNKAIDSISFEQKQAIFNKWVSLKVEGKTDYQLIIKWVVATIIIFGIILFIFINANLKLNKEIAKRKKIEKRLESFNTLIDETIISSSTDLEGIITEVSSAFCKISKHSQKELIGENQNIVRHPDMSAKVFEELWETIKADNVWEGEIKNIAKDGSTYWVYTTISPKFDEYNNKIGYVSIRQDITDKKKIEEISITDGLTNIYNRRHFNEFFPKFVNSSKRENQFISFIILDIDFFKQYNDTYGHQKGDDVLIMVSDCLKKSAHRSDDYCFRLGGEEFGLLFKSKDKNKALEFANKILKNIEELKIEHKNSKASVYVTVSMGLYSNYANDVVSIDDVYKKADKLLYSAKESGRNKVVSN
jgi:diguanylate cyclase (GGDEF)-like protein/PAS domain S-box-containing protein